MIDRNLDFFEVTVNGRSTKHPVLVVEPPKKEKKPKKFPLEYSYDVPDKPGFIKRIHRCIRLHPTKGFRNEREWCEVLKVDKPASSASEDGQE